LASLSAKEIAGEIVSKMAMMMEWLSFIALKITHLKTL
jgi:hypothetical protein